MDNNFSSDQQEKSKNFKRSKNQYENKQFAFYDWKKSGIELLVNEYYQRGCLDVESQSNCWKLFYPKIRKDEIDLDYCITRHNREEDKYILPKGKMPRVFRPLDFDIDFNYKTIYITEGEKKAIAGVSRGIPTLAISGCYNWRQKDGKTEGKIIDDLEQVINICLQKKISIVLLSDSDYRLNQQVREGWYKLFIALKKQNVKDVELKVIPLGNDESSGTKFGLDDYLLWMKDYTQEEVFELINGIPKEKLCDDNILAFENMPKISNIEVPEDIKIFKSAKIDHFNENSLVVINGSTNIGKTWLLVRLAEAFSRVGHNCLFISLEMGLSEIVSRYKSIYAPDRFPEYLSNLVVVDDILGGNVSSIEDKVFVNNSKVIFIDYLQYIRPKGEEEQRMSDCMFVDYKMQKLKQIANKLNAVIFLISSMNRESVKNNLEDKTNIVGISGKGSGGIEYGADFVFNVLPHMVDCKNGEEDKSVKGKGKVKKEPEVQDGVKTLVFQCSKNRQYAFDSRAYKIYFDTNEMNFTTKPQQEYINEGD